MGYSDSPKTLKQYKSYLDILVKGIEEGRKSISFASDEPGKLAYKLRECCSIAAKLSMPKIADLKQHYIFKVVGLTVIAQRNRDLTAEVVTIIDDAVDQFDVVLEILEIGIDNIHSPILFPKVNKDNQEVLGEILEWCELKGLTMTTLSQGIKIERIL